MTERDGRQETGVQPIKLRIELGLMGLFSAAWIWGFLIYVGWVPFSGSLNLGLYRLYSVAAVIGWVAGNVYMLRKERLPKSRGYRKRALLAYGLGPLSLTFLLRALAPAEVLAAAPLVPLYAASVQTLFFLVPVSLRLNRVQRRDQ